MPTDQNSCVSLNLAHVEHSVNYFFSFSLLRQIRHHNDTNSDIEIRSNIIIFIILAQQCIMDAQVLTLRRLRPDSDQVLDNQQSSPWPS
jgi:hypothetical protein